MSSNFKIFLVSFFIACILNIALTQRISVADESSPGGKSQITIDNEKAQAISEAVKNKMKYMEALQQKELLNYIESQVNANNRSYRSIYIGTLFAGVIFAFLTLCIKKTKNRTNSGSKNIYEARD